MIAVYPLLYQVSANRHQPYFDLFTNVHDAAQCYTVLPYKIEHLFVKQGFRE